MSRKSLELARQTADEITVAEALHAFGISLVRSHMTTDDCHAANAVFDEALVLFRAHKDVLGIAKILTCKGEVARLQENFELAEGFNKEAASLFSQLGNSSGVSISVTNLGWISHRLGSYRRAEEYFRDGLNLAQQIHDKSATLGAVAGLAGLAATSRQSDRAIRLFGSIETQQKVYGNGVCAADLTDYDICITTARVQMGEARFSQLWEEGRSLTLETAIACVIGELDA